MDHRTRVYDSVFEMMPNEDNPTPLVRLNRLNPAPDFPLYAKLEWVNPFGSVKDRAAWEMLRDLEERGEVQGSIVGHEHRAIQASAWRRWRGRTDTTCAPWCRTGCRWRRRCC